MGHFRADDAGPQEQVRGPSELAEKLIDAMGDAGVPQDVIDRVLEPLEAWEFFSNVPNYGLPEHPDGWHDACACDECMAEGEA